MEAYQLCLVTLLLTAAATYSNPTLPPTPNVNASHNTHVPREPRVDHPHPPIPPHGAVLDKPAHPSLPRDTNVGSISCTTDANCTSSAMGENSICHGIMCSCKPGTTQSATTQKCLRESALGSGCEEDWQCIRPLGPTVSCNKYICACVSGAIVVNGKCWKQKLLSEQCQSTEECLAGRDTECSDNRCACKSGLTPKPSNDKCLPVATKFNDPCEEDIQCTEAFGPAALCSNAKCVCREGYHHKNHACMKNLLLGETCGTGIDGDCFLIHDQGINKVDCKDGKCQCKDDRIPSSDNQKCLSQAEKDDGSGGGAESVQPLLLTFVTILFAIFLAS